MAKKENSVVDTPVKEEGVAIREDRLDKGVAYYKKFGKIVPFVDTCRDLDDKEKAMLLEDILVRVNPNKTPKYNPYKG